MPGKNSREAYRRQTIKKKKKSYLFTDWLVLNCSTEYLPKIHTDNMAGQTRTGICLVKLTKLDRPPFWFTLAGPARWK